MVNNELCNIKKVIRFSKNYCGGCGSPISTWNSDPVVFPCKELFNHLHPFVVCVRI